MGAMSLRERVLTALSHREPDRVPIDLGEYTYFTDEWGIGWRMPKEGGYYYDMVNHPLAEAGVGEIRRYRGPDVRDAGRVEGLAERTRALRESTDFAVFPEIGGPGMFEGAWFLRGMERFMVDMLTDRKAAEALLDKILEIMYLS